MSSRSGEHSARRRLIAADTVALAGGGDRILNPETPTTDVRRAANIAGPRLHVAARDIGQGTRLTELFLAAGPALPSLLDHYDSDRVFVLDGEKALIYGQGAGYEMAIVGPTLPILPRFTDQWSTTRGRSNLEISGAPHVDLDGTIVSLSTSRDVCRGELLVAYVRSDRS